MNAADHYATLGVAQDVSPGEVKRVFQELALQHHPDKCGGMFLVLSYTPYLSCAKSLFWSSNFVRILLTK